MKKNTITMILAMTTISSLAWGVGAYYTNAKEIESKKLEIQEMTKKISELEKQSEGKDAMLSALETEMIKVEEQLESARRRIEELNRTVIADSNDVTVLSKTTDAHMRRALEGTELYSLTDTFVAAENDYGINAYFLAAVAAHESAWGKSDKATLYNNLTGYAAYDSLTRGAVFDSKSTGINKTAELLANDYIKPGAKYYNGTSISAINKKYCLKEDRRTVDYGWTESITSIMNGLINKANNFERSY